MDKYGHEFYAEKKVAQWMMIIKKIGLLKRTHEKISL